MSELADPYRNGKSSQRPYGDWVSLRIWGRGVGVAGVNSDTPLFAILRKLVPRGTVNAMNRERLVKAAGICELGGSIWKLNVGFTPSGVARCGRVFSQARKTACPR